MNTDEGRVTDMASPGGVYDPHLGYRVDADGRPSEPEPERLIDSRSRRTTELRGSARPWDDDRRAALLGEIRRSVKHFRPHPASEQHARNPAASGDELAQALCDLLTKDWAESAVELHLRTAWLLGPRPIGQLLGLRRRA